MAKLGVLTVAALLVFGAAMPTAWAQTSRNVDGTVTKVDEPAQRLTIRHGPMKEFGMDTGMTMVFRAAEPAMLKAVKADDHVKFDVERINGLFTVTRIEKAR
jgi:Cu(I)/Ag(I) efflux system protein CusF